MARFLRYLRIAFSATCLVACLFLIALWVRSYWWADHVVQVNGNSATTHVYSNLGIVGISRTTESATQNEFTNAGWRYTVRSPAGREFPLPKFEWYWANGEISVRLPTWLPAIAFVVAATALWIRWSNRFSLRTLLIATTLVAIVLGLIVWLRQVSA